MTGDNAGSHWPGTDERSAVEEMLRDQYSKHWEECRKVVKQRVYVRAKNIPTNRRDEIIQDVMVKIVRYLPGFHFHCALKTWLSFIIESCIIDVHRNVRNEGQFSARPGDALNENGYQGDSSEVRSAEDTFLLNEELRNAIAALWEYAGMHSNPTRDRLIVRMVIFEGHNHIETAKVAGCSAPVVGYVVREAQRYAREKMGHKL
ncbi:MAG TPA: sigma-70 family RNA polymerase sigma factor [Ktedonobacteraceae bacterium]